MSLLSALLLVLVLTTQTYAARKDIPFTAVGFSAADQLSCALKIDPTKETEVCRGTELLMITQEQAGAPFYPAVATFSSTGTAVSVQRLGSLEFPALAVGGTTVDPVLQVATVIDDKRKLLECTTRRRVINFTRLTSAVLEISVMLLSICPPIDFMDSTGMASPRSSCRSN